MLRVVLAIDPGRLKCGVAVAQKAADDTESVVEVHYRGVVGSDELRGTLAYLAGRFNLDAIVIGSGTGSAQARQVADDLHVAPVKLVDERNSTLAARKRYFEDNPPRGLRKLITVSLLTPDRPYDDYVAVILAEKYLREAVS